MLYPRPDDVPFPTQGVLQTVHKLRSVRPNLRGAGPKSLTLR